MFASLSAVMRLEVLAKGIRAEIKMCYLFVVALYVGITESHM